MPKETVLLGEYAEDIGDVESSARIFRHFLKLHPNGECLIYEQWPGMARKLGADGKPFKEPSPSDPNTTDWAPDREGFDFVKHWETMKYDPAAKWNGATFRTRDYFHKLMEDLKARLPEVWAAGRLECRGEHQSCGTVRRTAQFSHVLIDTNHWKSFVHTGLATAPSDRGCISLYGKTGTGSSGAQRRCACPRFAVAHVLFAEHVARSERCVEVIGPYGTVREWSVLPTKPDNHWLDCLVGCAVAASMLGVRVPGPGR